MAWENYLATINDFLWSYVLIILLIGAGIYFSFKTNFVQFRLIGDMFKLLGEGTSTEKGHAGVSSFQAFCVGTASRVGTGNLAGVAIAIALGGPGSIFWMWLIALIGSATGFIESTLAQIYKIKDGDTFRGGPAYYMEQGLNQRWMGVLFAILITITFGLVFNSVQANTIAVATETAFGFDKLYIGLFITFITAIVIVGGIKRIALIAQWIVPIMAGGYILLALFIIFKNITLLPAILYSIISSAFGFEQVAGGSVGSAISLGVKRGLFSNEAGMGSAPNAAAVADVSHPVKQGLIQALGVFTDTLMVCSATAFIILLSGIDLGTSVNGIELTQAALTVHVGSFANSLIAILVLLFAFSSIIGNYYYGETNIEFIKTSKVWLFLYRVAVLLMVLTGSIIEASTVWNMADLFMGLMAITNIIAIILLGKYAFMALEDYNKQKKMGQSPVFYQSNIKGLNAVECWKKK